MTNKSNLKIRFAASILIVAFLAQEIAQAAPLAGESPLFSNPQEIILKDPARFEAPVEFASLKELHRGGDGAFIIHIQDAHTNLSGQMNLAQALDAIMARYQVSLVLVEGGTRDDSLTELKTLAPPDVWKRVAKKFLVEGNISGEEYLNLVSDHPMKIMGIEEKPLYMSSLEAYSELAEKREAILDHLKGVRAKLAKAKNKAYPKLLSDYEKNADFTKNIERGLDGLRRLMEGDEEALRDLPGLRTILELKEEEEKINFESANLEQAALIETLKKSGGQDPGKNLEILRRLKGDRLSQFAYFQNCLNIAKEKKLRLSAYPNLLAYARYLEKFQQLDLGVVLREMEIFEERAYASLLETEDARLLHAIDRYSRLLETAYGIRMSASEFERFDANEPDFADAAFTGFLNRKLAEMGYYGDFVPYSDVLEKGRDSLHRFYGKVRERDFAFVKNAGRILAEEKQKVAVLIAGGYHTDHLTKLFREKGYSYAVLAPVVTSETNQKKYEELLLRPVRKEVQKVDSVQGESAASDKPLSSLEEDLLRIKKKSDTLGKTKVAEDSTDLPVIANYAWSLAPAGRRPSKEVLAATVLRTLGPSGENLAPDVQVPGVRLAAVYREPVWLAGQAGATLEEREDALVRQLFEERKRTGKSPLSNAQQRYFKDHRRLHEKVRHAFRRPPWFPGDYTQGDEERTRLFLQELHNAGNFKALDEKYGLSQGVIAAHLRANYPEILEQAKVVLLPYWFPGGIFDSLERRKALLENAVIDAESWMKFALSAQAETPAISGYLSDNFPDLRDRINERLNAPSWLSGSARDSLKSRYFLTAVDILKYGGFSGFAQQRDQKSNTVISYVTHHDELGVMLKIYKKLLAEDLQDDSMSYDRMLILSAMEIAGAGGISAFADKKKLDSETVQSFVSYYPEVGIFVEAARGWELLKQWLADPASSGDEANFAFVDETYDDGTFKINLPERDGKRKVSITIGSGAGSPGHAVILCRKTRDGDWRVFSRRKVRSNYVEIEYKFVPHPERPGSLTLEKIRRAGVTSAYQIARGQKTDELIRQRLRFDRIQGEMTLVRLAELLDIPLGTLETRDYKWFVTEENDRRRAEGGILKPVVIGRARTNRRWLATEALIRERLRSSQISGKTTAQQLVQSLGMALDTLIEHDYRNKVLEENARRQAERLRLPPIELFEQGETRGETIRTTAWERETAILRRSRSLLDDFVELNSFDAVRQAELFKRARSGDDQALRDLVNGYFKLVLEAAKKAAGNSIHGDLYEEIVQEGYLVIYRAAVDFLRETSAGSLQDLGESIRLGIREVVDKAKRTALSFRKKKEASISEPLVSHSPRSQRGWDESFYEDILRGAGWEGDVFLDDLLLSKAEMTALKSYLIRGMNVSQIATEMRMDPGHVNRLLDSAVSALEAMGEKNLRGYVGLGGSKETPSGSRLSGASVTAKSGSGISRRNFGKGLTLTAAFSLFSNSAKGRILQEASRKAPAGRAVSFSRRQVQSWIEETFRDETVARESAFSRLLQAAIQDSSLREELIALFLNEIHFLSLNEATRGSADYFSEKLSILLSSTMDAPDLLMDLFRGSMDPVTRREALNLIRDRYLPEFLADRTDGTLIKQGDEIIERKTHPNLNAFVDALQDPWTSPAAKTILKMIAASGEAKRFELEKILLSKLYSLEIKQSASVETLNELLDDIASAQDLMDLLYEVEEPMRGWVAKRLAKAPGLDSAGAHFYPFYVLINLIEDATAHNDALKILGRVQIWEEDPREELKRKELAVEDAAHAKLIAEIMNDETTRAAASEALEGLLERHGPQAFFRVLGSPKGYTAQPKTSLKIEILKVLAKTETKRLRQLQIVNEPSFDEPVFENQINAYSVSMLIELLANPSAEQAAARVLQALDISDPGLLQELQKAREELADRSQRRQRFLEELKDVVQKTDLKDLAAFIMNGRAEEALAEADKTVLDFIRSGFVSGDAGSSPFDAETDRYLFHSLGLPTMGELYMDWLWQEKADFKAKLIKLTKMVAAQAQAQGIGYVFSMIEGDVGVYGLIEAAADPRTSRDALAVLNEMALDKLGLQLQRNLIRVLLSLKAGGQMTPDAEKLLARIPGDLSSEDFERVLTSLFVESVRAEKKVQDAVRREALALLIAEAQDPDGVLFLGGLPFAEALVAGSGNSALQEFVMEFFGHLKKQEVKLAVFERMIRDQFAAVVGLFDGLSVLSEIMDLLAKETDTRVYLDTARFLSVLSGYRAVPIGFDEARHLARGAADQPEGYTALASRSFLKPKIRKSFLEAVLWQRRLLLRQKDRESASSLRMILRMLASRDGGAGSFLEIFKNGLEPGIRSDALGILSGAKGRVALSKDPEAISILKQISELSWLYPRAQTVLKRLENAPAGDAKKAGARFTALEPLRPSGVRLMVEPGNAGSVQADYLKAVKDHVQKGDASSGRNLWLEKQRYVQVLIDRIAAGGTTYEFARYQILSLFIGLTGAAFEKEKNELMAFFEARWLAWRDRAGTRLGGDGEFGLFQGYLAWNAFNVLPRDLWIFDLMHKNLEDAVALGLVSDELAFAISRFPVDPREMAKYMSAWSPALQKEAWRLLSPMGFAVSDANGLDLSRSSEEWRRYRRQFVEMTERPKELDFWESEEPSRTKKPALPPPHWVPYKLRGLWAVAESGFLQNILEARPASLRKQLFAWWVNGRNRGLKRQMLSFSPARERPETEAALSKADPVLLYLIGSSMRRVSAYRKHVHKELQSYFGKNWSQRADKIRQMRRHFDDAESLRMLHMAADSDEFEQVKEAAKEVIAGLRQPPRDAGVRFSSPQKIANAVMGFDDGSERGAWADSSYGLMPNGSEASFVHPLDWWPKASNQERLEVAEQVASSQYGIARAQENLRPLIEHPDTEAFGRVAAQIWETIAGFGQSLRGARMAEARLTRDRLRIGPKYQVRDGLEAIEQITIDGPGAFAQGEAFFVDVNRLLAVQRYSADFLDRDLMDSPLIPNDLLAGLTIDEWVAQERSRRADIFPGLNPDPEQVVLAVNSTQGHFVDPNTILVIDGHLVAKPEGKRAAGQHSYEPLDGPYWLLSLDAGRPGIYRVDLDKGHYDGILPVKNGFAGTLLLKDGRPQLDRIKFGVFPSVRGDELNWSSVDKRQSLSGFGYDGAGRLVIVHLTGDPDDNSRPEPSVKHLVDVLLSLGVTDAIVGGTSADVQRYTHDLVNDRRGKFAKSRKGSGLGQLLERGGQRRVATALMFYSRPDGNEADLAMRSHEAELVAVEHFLERYRGKEARSSEREETVRAFDRLNKAASRIVHEMLLRKSLEDIPQEAITKARVGDWLNAPVEVLEAVVTAIKRHENAADFAVARDLVFRSLNAAQKLKDLRAHQVREDSKKRQHYSRQAVFARFALRLAPRDENLSLDYLLVLIHLGHLREAESFLNGIKDVVDLRDWNLNAGYLKIRRAARAFKDYLKNGPDAESTFSFILSRYREAAGHLEEVVAAGANGKTPLAYSRFAGLEMLMRKVHAVRKERGLSKEADIFRHAVSAFIYAVAALKADASNRHSKNIYLDSLRELADEMASARAHLDEPGFSEPASRLRAVRKDALRYGKITSISGSLLKTLFGARFADRREPAHGTGFLSALKEDWPQVVIETVFFFLAAALAAKLHSALHGIPVWRTLLWTPLIAVGLTISVHVMNGLRSFFIEKNQPTIATAPEPKNETLPADKKNVRKSAASGVRLSSRTSKDPLREEIKLAHRDLSRKKTALRNIFMGTLRPLREKALSRELLEEAFRRRNEQIAALIASIRQIKIRLSLLEYDPEGYAYLTIDNVPECGMCKDVSRILFKALVLSGLNPKPIEIKVGPEETLVHLLVGLVLPEGVLAIDPTAGQFAERYSGMTVILPLKDYESLVVPLIEQQNDLLPLDSEKGQVQFLQLMEVNRRFLEERAELMRELYDDESYALAAGGRFSDIQNITGPFIAADSLQILLDSMGSLQAGVRYDHDEAAKESGWLPVYEKAGYLEFTISDAGKAFFEDAFGVKDLATQGYLLTREMPGNVYKTRCGVLKALPAGILFRAQDGRAFFFNLLPFFLDKAKTKLSPASQSFVDFMGQKLLGSSMPIRTVGLDRLRVKYGFELPGLRSLRERTGYDGEFDIFTLSDPGAKGALRVLTPQDEHSKDFQTTLSAAGRIVQGRPVQEIGAGTGINALGLALLGAASYRGTEISFSQSVIARVNVRLAADLGRIPEIPIEIVHGKGFPEGPDAEDAVYLFNAGGVVGVKETREMRDVSRQIPIQDYLELVRQLKERLSLPGSRKALWRVHGHSPDSGLAEVKEEEYFRFDSDDMHREWMQLTTERFLGAQNFIWTPTPYYEDIVLITGVKGVRLAKKEVAFKLYRIGSDLVNDWQYLIDNKLLIMDRERERLYEAMKKWKLGREDAVDGTAVVAYAKEGKRWMPVGIQMFISLSNKKVRANGLFVDEDFRRWGIALKLREQVLAYLKAQGYKEFETGADKTEEAQKFHEAWIRSLPPEAVTVRRYPDTNLIFSITVNLKNYRPVVRFGEKVLVEREDPAGERAVAGVRLAESPRKGDKVVLYGTRYEIVDDDVEIEIPGQTLKGLELQDEKGQRTRVFGRSLRDIEIVAPDEGVPPGPAGSEFKNQLKKWVEGKIFKRLDGGNQFTVYEVEDEPVCPLVLKIPVAPLGDFEDEEPVTLEEFSRALGFMGGLMPASTVLETVKITIKDEAGYLKTREVPWLALQKKMIRFGTEEVPERFRVSDSFTIENARQKAKELILRLIERGIYYKDLIDVTNIGVDPDTGEILFLDFGSAEHLGKESEGEGAPGLALEEEWMIIALPPDYVGAHWASKVNETVPVVDVQLPAGARLASAAKAAEWTLDSFENGVHEYALRDRLGPRLLTPLSPRSFLARQHETFMLKQSSAGAPQIADRLPPARQSWSFDHSLDRVLSGLGRDLVSDVVAHVRRRPGQKISVLGWGVGEGMEISDFAGRVAKSLEEQGLPQDAVRFYGFADQYFAEWSRAHPAVTFILDTTDRLPEYFDGNEIVLVYSYLGLHHLPSAEYIRLLDRLQSKLHEEGMIVHNSARPSDVARLSGYREPSWWDGRTGRTVVYLMPDKPVPTSRASAARNSHPSASTVGSRLVEAQDAESALENHLSHMNYKPDWWSEAIERRSLQVLPALIKEIEPFFELKPLSTALSNTVRSHDDDYQKALKIADSPYGEWFDWDRLEDYSGTYMAGRSVWTNFGAWKSRFSYGYPILNIEFEGKVIDPDAAKSVYRTVAEFVSVRLQDLAQEIDIDGQLTPYVYDIVLSFFQADGVEVLDDQNHWLLIKNQGAIRSVKLAAGKPLRASDAPTASGVRLSDPDYPSLIEITIRAYDVLAKEGIWGFRFGHIDLPRTRSFLSPFIEHLPDEGDILDVGSSAGRFTDALQKVFPQRRVLGIDLSEEMNAVAREEHPWIRGQFLRMDLNHLDFADHSFAGLLYAGTFSEIPAVQVPQALAEARRVLEENGVIFASVVTDKFFADPAYVQLSYVDPQAKEGITFNDRWGRGGWLSLDELGLPRFFKVYTMEEFKRVFQENGFDVLEAWAEPGGEWLNLTAVRRGVRLASNQPSFDKSEVGGPWLQVGEDIRVMNTAFVRLMELAYWFVRTPDRRQLLASNPQDAGTLEAILTLYRTQQGRNVYWKGKRQSDVFRSLMEKMFNLLKDYLIANLPERESDELKAGLENWLRWHTVQDLIRQYYEVTGIQLSEDLLRDPARSEHVMKHERAHWAVDQKASEEEKEILERAYREFIRDPEGALALTMGFKAASRYESDIREDLKDAEHDDKPLRFWLEFWGQSAYPSGDFEQGKYFASFRRVFERLRDSGGVFAEAVSINQKYVAIGDGRAVLDRASIAVNYKNPGVRLAAPTGSVEILGDKELRFYFNDLDLGPREPLIVLLPAEGRIKGAREYYGRHPREILVADADPKSVETGYERYNSEYLEPLKKKAATLTGDDERKIRQIFILTANALGGMEREDIDRLSMAHPDFAEIKEAKENNHRIVENVADFVRNNVNRRMPLGFFIANDSGVCRHRAQLFKELAAAAGLKVQFKTGQVPGGRHAWNEVETSAHERYFVDVFYSPDVVRISGQKSEASRRHFKSDVMSVSVKSVVWNVYDRFNVELRPAGRAGHLMLVITPKSIDGDRGVVFGRLDFERDAKKAAGLDYRLRPGKYSLNEEGELVKVAEVEAAPTAPQGADEAAPVRFEGKLYKGDVRFGIPGKFGLELHVLTVDGKRVVRLVKHDAGGNRRPLRNGEGKILEYELKENGYVDIGRSSRNKLQVPSEYGYTSRFHAVVQVRNGEVWVNDNSSTNGTKMLGPVGVVDAAGVRLAEDKESLVILPPESNSVVEVLPTLSPVVSGRSSQEKPELRGIGVSSLIKDGARLARQTAAEPGEQAPEAVAADLRFLGGIARTFAETAADFWVAPGLAWDDLPESEKKIFAELAAFSLPLLKKGDYAFEINTKEGLRRAVIHARRLDSRDVEFTLADNKGRTITTLTALEKDISKTRSIGNERQILESAALTPTFVAAEVVADSRHLEDFADKAHDEMKKASLLEASVPVALVVLLTEGENPEALAVKVRGFKEKDPAVRFQFVRAVDGRLEIVALPGLPSDAIDGDMKRVFVAPLTEANAALASENGMSFQPKRPAQVSTVLPYAVYPDQALWRLAADAERLPRVEGSLKGVPEALVDLQVRLAESSYDDEIRSHSVEYFEARWHPVSGFESLKKIAASYIRLLTIDELTAYLRIISKTVDVSA